MKRRLTLLPFSGLHLHPLLQSSPAHGSFGSKPCRGKDKERTGRYNKYLNHIFVFALENCWLIKANKSAFPFLLCKRLHVQAWVWILSLHKSPHESKKTIKQRARSMDSSDPCSCLRLELADLQPFRKKLEDLKWILRIRWRRWLFI